MSKVSNLENISLQNISQELHWRVVVLLDEPYFETGMGIALPKGMLRKTLIKRKYKNHPFSGKW